MTIRVLSFDFDGCLFNIDYLYSEEKDVIKSNKDFLTRIKQENLEFTKTYTLVGSNRQSKNSDMANFLHRGSCFPAIKRISNFLGTTFDPFLLADVFGNLPSGTSYERAMARNYREHKEWMFDETKVTIMYAQMHKIAHENPGEEIIFDFYDDRGNGARQEVDILEKLSNFYHKNKELIPDNVTLRLHQYAGNDVTPITQIKGTGFIDENYRQTVKDLAHQAETTYDGIHSRPIHVADHAKPQLLKNRKPLSITPPLMLNEKYKTAKAKFAIALNNIAKKAEELDEKGDNIFKFSTNEKQSDLYYSYKAAATAARQLYDAVVNESKFHPIDKEQLAFKKAVDDAIKVAINSELGNHRGYLKEIIGQVALAVLAVLTVATAGIAYAIAGGINYAVHRQFFFSTKFTTDSIDKVLDLKEAVDVLITSHP